MKPLHNVCELCTAKERIEKLYVLINPINLKFVFLLGWLDLLAGKISNVTLCRPAVTSLKISVGTPIDHPRFQYPARVTAFERSSSKTISHEEFRQLREKSGGKTERTHRLRRRLGRRSENVASPPWSFHLFQPQSRNWPSTLVCPQSNTACLLPNHTSPICEQFFTTSVRVLLTEREARLTQHYESVR